LDRVGVDGGWDRGEWVVVGGDIGGREEIGAGVG